MAAETKELQKAETQAMEMPERTRSRHVFAPRADIYETADSIAVVADMAGVDEKGIDINLEKNVLTIRGRTGELSLEGYKPAYSEYAKGDYERSFILSDWVDRQRIDATIKDGVLRLVLPKAKEAVSRKIPVKTG
jgi:HSP20 family molecular chaperone IbpA